MTRCTVAILLLGLLAGRCRAATYTVEPGSAAASDGNTGSSERPRKSLGKALEVAAGGDTIVLYSAEYPAAAFEKSYQKTLTVAAGKDQKPVMTQGLSFRKAGNIKLDGLTFTWPRDKRPAARTTFLEMTNSWGIWLRS